MEKDERLNKKSPSYIPTYDELRLPSDLIRRLETEYEDPIKMERNDKEYQRYVEAWQEKHKRRLAEQIQLKAEREKIKLAAHWYVTLSEREKEILIEESRKLADDVFATQQTSLDRIATYYTKLQMRVNKGSFSLLEADAKKLKSFPKYDPYTGKLYGSASSFIRLWSHVFTLRLESIKRGRFNT